MTNLSQGFGDNTLFSGLEGLVEVGERIAIIGENGVGKTTLLNTFAGRLAPKSGEFKWSENANIGYYAQDHADEFATDMNLFEWMEQWQQEGDDEQVVRSFLGRMLFSQNDIKKSVKVISGGEQGRMLFGKIMMHKPNILLMDEPTNHMDMESIEALNLALKPTKVLYCLCLTIANLYHRLLRVSGKLKTVRLLTLEVPTLST